MNNPACRTNGVPPLGRPRCLGLWDVSRNFLFPQRDQPLLLPVGMREWLPEDDLMFTVLDAVATLDLGGFRRRHRADGHGRAASGPVMMVALLLSGYCQRVAGEAVRPGRRLPGGHRRAAPRSPSPGAG
jgi:hypothetical protein